MADANQITAVLQALSSGDQNETDRLMPLVYDEMREIAARYMSRQPAGHTLRSTALVNEAYLKLCSGEDANWRGRSHFFAAGAQAMRRILVDHARAKSRDKRGGDLQRVELEENLLGREQPNEDILALNEAIIKLQDLDPRQAQIVELRFFGGMTVQQVAEAIGVSKRTVELEWKMVRAWLRKELAEDTAP